MIAFIISLSSFLFVICIMVFIHEWGHFYMARLCGVKVDVFAIGFGKTLWSKVDNKGTEWKVNLLPLGGYVKMFGDAGPASNSDMEKINTMNDSEKNVSFFHKKLWQKALIVFAGPFMNYVLAFVVMVMCISVYGEKSLSTEISMVEQSGPADNAGLIIGDIIKSINGQKVNDMFNVRNIIENSLAELQVVFIRNDIEKTVILLPVMKENNIRKIGIAGTEISVQYTLLSAIPQGINKIYHLNTMMLSGIMQLLSGKGSMQDLGGPIKIARITGEAIQTGLQPFLHLLILLSLNLGLLNLMPIPGLDGGHLMYYLLNAIFGRQIPQSIQTMGIRIGLLLLIALMIFVTCNDIFNL